MAAKKTAKLKELMYRHAVLGPARPSDVPDVLYHYTDAAGLIGTLQSSRIWATDYRYLNDRSEIRHTDTIAHRLASDRLRSTTSPALRELYSRIIADPNMMKTAPLFIYSLSADRDSLSQWRGYARDGRGFTIGYSRTELLDKDVWEEKFDIRQVEYRHDVQERGIRIALEDIEKELEKICTDSSVDIDSAAESAYTCFRLIVMSHSAVNKHKSFASEVEWRISAHYDATNPKDAPPLARVRGLELIPYTTFAPVSGKLPIVEIGIGPGFDSQAQRTAVEVLCQQYGYSPVIYEADSPYRGG